MSQDDVLRQPPTLHFIRNQWWQILRFCNSSPEFDSGISWNILAPRLEEEWKNPWVDYQTAMDSDNYKTKLAKDRNMLYFVVWSDDDKNQKMNEIQTIITELWRKYDKHIT